MTGSWGVIMVNDFMLRSFLGDGDGLFKKRLKVFGN